MKVSRFPSPQGLYDPSNEHDACGFGFVVDVKARPSHDIVRMALRVLSNLEHRGATGSEKNTGDGAGLLSQVPHGFLSAWARTGGLELPPPGDYGVGMLFLPVEAASRQACQRRLEEIVAAYIRDQLRDRGLERVQVKEIRGAESMVLPKGRLSWQVTAPRNSPLTGSVPLAVTLKVNDDFERRLNVTAVVEVRVKVVVSSRPLGRYKPIEESDILIREADLTGLPADFISDPEAVIGKRTRRAVDANAVLRPDLVELPPVVKRGDRVRIVAESAGMRISAAGEVKQKGCVGERIPVVNLDSNKVIYARVVDGQTVRIEY